ncbi:uncharacterized protein RAG0_03252 [Rhynchosporium agropyri]|uniref:Uncharacterized protein n=1 Tax=Rhynchosporium agropyri TaxID=914238 RepID=A0A1E1K4B3_9HELO|nr:uncharacterized protein RAG0_03252 [Rhynchosporium agropyri]
MNGQYRQKCRSIASPLFMRHIVLISLAFLEPPNALQYVSNETQKWKSDAVATLPALITTEPALFPAYYSARESCGGGVTVTRPPKLGLLRTEYKVPVNTSPAHEGDNTQHDVNRHMLALLYSDGHFFVYESTYRLVGRGSQGEVASRQEKQHHVA